MKKFLLLTFSLLAFTIVSYGQQEQGTIRVSGGLVYGTDVEEIGLNFGGEYLFTEAISASPSFTIFLVESGLTYTNINIDGRYYFLTGGPYVYGLAGLVNTSVKVDFGAFGSFSDSEVGLNIGGGALFPINDLVSINAQLKYSTPYDGQLVLQGGVAFSF